jgi:hypothetical protein
MVNDPRPLLGQASGALKHGDPTAALWSLLAWGDQKVDPRSALSDKDAREVAVNLIGAVTEVAYALDDPAHERHDGLDAIDYLANKWGDERPIPIRGSDE